MKRYKLFGISLLISILLIGCGGDSSGDNTTQTQNELTQIGIIVDSQIIGLRYVSTNKDKTQTKKGITNSKGEFEYFKGGTTEFFVGKIKIGETTPNKMVVITTIKKTEKESENVARFLQTIDEDNNPDNGIQISSSVDEHAKEDSVSSLKFDDSFDTNFDNAKTELFKHAANIPATITVEQALNHSSKSERLSSMNEFDLYKAIANEKNYRGGDYYNADVLEKDQRKRVYLWIWEKLLSKEMAIEDELQFSKPEFDINNVEETRNQIKKYLDYADSVVGVGSLASGTMENLAKAGNRTMSYNISKLTSLTVGGCDATVKLYDSNTEDTQELGDTDLCKNIMKVVNPVGDSASKLAVANPILSGFLPELLPKLVHAQKMNWLHFNTKSLRTISKMKVSKPDVVSIALSIAQISNDFYGASWASDINEEQTTRMVAREWLSIWFRSGFKQDYMNKLINNNSKKLIGLQEQIEALALKLGSTGALCDTYKFFNPFYECTGIENINYNYKKVVDIVNRKLSKSNALYRNITDLTGSLSNEKAEIGVTEINWVRDTNVSDYNTKPVAIPQTIKTEENIKKDITLGGSDEDNDTLSYEIISNPLNGILTGTAPNLVYTPTTDYTGSDSFTFKVSDGKSDSNIETINMSIVQNENLSTAIFHYRDDFNDLNQSFWYIVRMYGPAGPYWKNNVTDYNSVTLSDGIITLTMDKIDDGPVMYSKPIKINKGDIITIKRRVKIHQSNRYFSGQMAIVSSDNNFSIDTSETLASIGYYDYTYNGDWDTFSLNNRDDSSTYINPIWDDWFEEELIYNSSTGESIYKINNNIVRHSLKILNKDYIKIKIHSYGWWTGHYTKMDYIDISINSIKK